MKLGIIGAMDVEIEILKQHMSDCTEVRHSSMNFCMGILEGVPTVAVVCGVGKVNAAVCTQILCDWFHITHLVNTGIAGSLCVGQEIGDLVVSWDAMHHDFDCTAFGYPIGMVPHMPMAYPADSILQHYAHKAAFRVYPGHARIGRIASGDQFISDVESKYNVLRRTGALCVEMEGAAIAQTAYMNRVPFVIIRSISDKADDSADLDYDTFEKEAAERSAQVVLEMAKALYSNYIRKEEYNEVT